MRDILGVVWRLVVLMVAAGLCLGLTNAVTVDRIAVQEEQTAQALRQAVLPGADGFEAMNISEGGVKEVYLASAASQPCGYVFEMLSSGFGGEISLTVGVQDGAVTGVRIASHSETPGLGANADSDSFLGQFAGKSGEIAVIKNAEPAEDEILAVTAATITSRAVTSAVNEALAYYRANLA